MVLRSSIARRPRSWSIDANWASVSIATSSSVRCGPVERFGCRGISIRVGTGRRIGRSSDLKFRTAQLVAMVAGATGELGRAVPACRGFRTPCDAGENESSVLKNSTPDTPFERPGGLGGDENRNARDRVNGSTEWQSVSPAAFPTKNGSCGDLSRSRVPAISGGVPVAARGADLRPPGRCCARSHPPMAPR